MCNGATQTNEGDVSYSIRSYKSPEPFVITSSNFICPSNHPVSTRKNMISREMTTFQGHKFNQRTHTQTEFQDPNRAQQSLKQVQLQIERQKQLIKEEIQAQRKEIEKRIADGRLTLEDFKQMDEFQEADIMAYLTNLEKEGLEQLEAEQPENPVFKSKINRVRLDELNSMNEAEIQAEENQASKTMKSSNAKSVTKMPTGIKDLISVNTRQRSKAQNELFDQIWETKSNALLESQKDHKSMMGDLQQKKQLQQLASETASRLNVTTKRLEKLETSKGVKTRANSKQKAIESLLINPKHQMPKEENEKKIEPA